MCMALWLVCAKMARANPRGNDICESSGVETITPMQCAMERFIAMMLHLCIWKLTDKFLEFE